MDAMYDHFTLTYEISIHVQKSTNLTYGVD
jgi:hypothetical protein